MARILSRIACLFIFILVVLTWQPAVAGTRVALVVGNAEYRHVPVLQNTRNDASDIAAALQRLGFTVQLVSDADFGTMRRQLQSLAKRAVGAEVALVYFAGHGIEIDRSNYLIPVDAQLKSDQDVDFEAVPLDLVMNAVSGAKGLRLVMLDACRDNPFASKMSRTSGTRSIGRGLARVEPAASTLVSFAAKEGTTAADGDGRNSPYTAALLRHIETPGLEISLMFRKVRDTVVEATQNRQQPFTYGSLPGVNIFLSVNTTIVQPPVQDKARPQPQPAPKVSDRELDLAFWKSISTSQDAADFRAYLSKFPEGVFSLLARNKLQQLARLEKEAPAPAPPPPPKRKRGFTDWMSSSAYQNLFDAMVGRRRYPVQVEGATVSGMRQFRAKFTSYPAGRFWFWAHHGISHSQFQARDRKLRSEGYRLIHKQVAKDQYGAYVQAVWVRR